MTTRNINRKIADEEFQYGNHIIKVRIDLHTRYIRESDSAIMNNAGGSHYYRTVSVRALTPEDCESDYETIYPDVKNESHVAVDVDVDSDSDVHWFFDLFNKPTRIPDIPEQIEHTVRPVLEELDELYEYTSRDTDVEIAVTMEYVEQEKSWIDVDDGVDEISQELDSEVEL